MSVLNVKPVFQGPKVVFLGGVMAAVLAGCGSSPEEKEMEAQATKMRTEAELNVEKKKTYQEYKKCVRDSGGDEKKLRSCEAMLKLLNEMPKEGGGTVQ